MKPFKTGSQSSIDPVHYLESVTILGNGPPPAYIESYMTFELKPCGHFERWKTREAV